MKPLLLVFVVCPLIGTAASLTALLAHLPNSQVNAVQTDVAGNIYISGFQGTLPAAHAFVDKLSPTGNVLYSTTFAGSNTDVAAAIAVDSTGAAYILGQTTSPDFPVTSGALQTTLQATNGQGFVAKVDPSGKVVYATFIGGSALIDPGTNGLALDSAGEAIISGQTIGGVFPTTAGAPFTTTDGNTFFVMKIDATGGSFSRRSAASAASSLWMFRAVSTSPARSSARTARFPSRQARFREPFNCKHAAGARNCPPPAPTNT
jgi:hypothetical protein